MTEKNKGSKQDEVTALVQEALPGTLFRVTVEDTKEEMLAYLAGKMVIRRVKVLVGDTVLIKRDLYGGQSRIIRRL